MEMEYGKYVYGPHEAIKRVTGSWLIVNAKSCIYNGRVCVQYLCGSD